MQIPLLEVGGTRTMQHISVANPLIKAVNALANMKFSPPGSGKITMTENGAVITINKPDGIGSSDSVVFDCWVNGVLHLATIPATITNPYSG